MLKTSGVATLMPKQTAYVKNKDDDNNYYRQWNRADLLSVSSTNVDFCIIYSTGRKFNPVLLKLIKTC